MLRYEMDGQGPPLLLIHGFGISFLIWRALIPYLRDHFTLIMVELPGIGDSPALVNGCSYLDAAANEIETLRAALGYSQWHVLSYSTGTRIGEHYLRRHTDRVAQAVFLCPAQTRVIPAMMLRAAIHIEAQFPLTGDWLLSGWRLLFLIRLLGFNLHPNSLIPAWFREITSQPMTILKETLRSVPSGGAVHFDVPEGKPVLFVWGREDLITATPRKPSTKHAIIHANHSAPQTAAWEVAEVILPFLKRVPALS